MENELKNKILNSGNNLHLDIASYLDMNGWQIELSPYYCDDITKIPREIDIIAKKTFAIFPDWENKLFRCPEEYKLDILLFIECKNFQNKFAFRVLKNDHELTKAVIISQSHNIFLPNEDFKKFGAIEYHHYFSDNIARLWDSLENRQEKDIFDAVTQPVKSLIFKEIYIKRKALLYPLVICKGFDGFYAVGEIEPSLIDDYLDRLQPVPQLTFGLKYAYKGRTIQGTEMSQNRDFYIDFILRDNLNKYLSSIERDDVNKIKEYLMRITKQTEFNYS